MSAFAPIADYPVTDIPAALDFSSGTRFSHIFDDPDRPFVFLVEVRPWTASLPTVEPGLPGPVADLPAAGGTEFSYYGGETAVRLSPQGWRSRPDDSVLPDTNFPARISGKGFTVSAELFAGTDPSTGGGTRGSEIEVLWDTANEAARAEADRWTRMGWDGRQLTIRAGRPEFDYVDFGVVAAWTVAGVSFEEGKATILPRDRSQIFERTLQQNLYAGTGGAEGHEGLAGSPKPLAFGRPINVPPTLLDQAVWTYDLHDGAIHAVDAVRDRGVALDFDADYESYAALAAASIPGGEYGTCLGEGKMRLGAEPDGPVTVDFRGDAAGGYVETCGAVLRRIVTTRLGARSLHDAKEIDGAAFAKLDAAFPAPIGFYETGAITAAEAIRLIEKSFYGRAFFTREGKLSVKRIVRPATTQYTLAKVQTETAGVSTDPRAAPPWRVRVGYGRNFTVQGRNELAGAASAVTGALELYGSEYRYATASSSAVRARHRLAETLDWPTLLALEEDAAALASTILGLSDPPLRRHKIPGLSALLRFWIGDAVTVKADAPGFPEEGLACLVAGVTEDPSAGTVDLEVVG